MINCVCEPEVGGNYIHSELSGRILKIFFEVYNNLGYGFLEKVYENALTLELKNAGIKFISQAQLHVYYHGQKIGRFYADLLIENKLIVEIKSCECLLPTHEAQLVNYLRASTLEAGILLNFGPEPDIKRKVLSNKYKKHIKNNQ